MRIVFFVRGRVVSVSECGTVRCKDLLPSIEATMSEFEKKALAAHKTCMLKHDEVVMFALYTVNPTAKVSI